MTCSLLIVFFSYLQRLLICSMSFPFSLTQSLWHVSSSPEVLDLCKSSSLHLLFCFFICFWGFLKKFGHIIFGSFCSRIQYNMLAFLVTNQIIYTHTLYLVSPGFRASYQLKSIWSFPLTSNIKKAYSSRGLLLTGFYWGNPSGSVVSDIFHQQRCHV